MKKGKCPSKNVSKVKRAPAKRQVSSQTSKPKGKY